MKRSKYFLVLFLALAFGLHSTQAFSQSDSSKTPTVLFQPGVPVIVSISNKISGGEAWRFDPTQNPSVNIIEQKSGYIFTYFTIQVSDPSASQLVFLTDSGKKRVFPLRISNSGSNNSQEIYGDIPSLSQSDGFLSRVSNATYSPLTPTTTASGIAGSDISNPTENPHSLSIPSDSNSISPEISIEPKKTMDPAITKRYIQKLIDNGLIAQARDTFDNLIAQPDIDTTWKYLTDLKLSKLSNNYQDVVDKSSDMLNQNMPSSDTEISIRKNRALALEKLGNSSEAEATLIYNTTYFPTNARAYMDLANFYLRQKDYKKALQQLLQIASEFPNIQELDYINYQIAICYGNIMGNDGYNLALGYYKKVLAFGPGSAYYQKSKNFVDFLEKNLLNYH